MWAQGGDEPASSDGPNVQAQGEGIGEEEGGAEGAGSERDLDCSDFETQEEAQRFFESRGDFDEDPHRLDEDPGEDDGRACEDLPSGNEDGSGGGGSDNDTPSGSVDSGFGPVSPAPEASESSPLALGAAGLDILVVGGLGVGRLSTRRMTRERRDRV